ncbi:hypothetical protein BLA29_003921 [Euroglyphus maynei]|uniref:Uncharacterized protein n=1 Tax=Euroglyphus maynei TaxID=6958 RepID=A0A1Y3AQJ4_EURMA|nr:hypothetical protein BLA29_003921 [Euroglyphus maynei]
MISYIDKVFHYRNHNEEEYYVVLSIYDQQRKYLSDLDIRYCNRDHRSNISDMHQLINYNETLVAFRLLHIENDPALDVT